MWNKMITTVHAQKVYYLETGAMMRKTKTHKISGPTDKTNARIFKSMS